MGSKWPWTVEVTYADGGMDFLAVEKVFNLAIMMKKDNPIIRIRVYETGKTMTEEVDAVDLYVDRFGNARSTRAIKRNETATFKVGDSPKIASAEEIEAEVARIRESLEPRHSTWGYHG